MLGRPKPNDVAVELIANPVWQADCGAITVTMHAKAKTQPAHPDQHRQGYPSKTED